MHVVCRYGCVEIVLTVAYSIVIVGSKFVRC